MPHFWHNASITQSDTTLSPRICSQLRAKPPQPLPSPTGIPVHRATTTTEVAAITHFLEATFGNPPTTPTFSPSLQPSDILLYVTDVSNTIVGTVRYTYCAHMDNTKFHVIDCFCIAPKWRRHGVGTYLLTELHALTMSLGLQYSLFLKEGPTLYQETQPIYSSTYVYMRNCNSNPTYPNVLSISHDTACRLIEIYTQLYPNTLTLVRNDTATKHVHWRLWRDNSHHMILASFQDSFQIHPTTQTAIGWCSGWLESATEPAPDVRDRAITEIMESVPYDWIWADKAWIRNMSNSPWCQDGAFHWYAYQWKPVHSINGRSYIIHA